jgi:hypothetical protein
MEKEDRVFQIAQTLFIGRCIRQMAMAQAGQLRISERLIEPERLGQDFEILVKYVREHLNEWE